MQRWLVSLLTAKRTLINALAVEHLPASEGAVVCLHGGKPDAAESGSFSHNFPLQRRQRAFQNILKE